MPPVLLYMPSVGALLGVCCVFCDLLRALCIVLCATTVVFCVLCRLRDCLLIYIVSIGVMLVLLPCSAPELRAVLSVVACCVLCSVFCALCSCVLCAACCAACCAAALIYPVLCCDMVCCAVL
jgi:hypothetical protein